MELSLSLEVASRSPIHEFPNILWNSKVQCPILKSSAAYTEQTNAIHTTQPAVSESLCLPLHLSENYRDQNYVIDVI
jgi:hypothetical protein